MNNYHENVEKKSNPDTKNEGPDAKKSDWRSFKARVHMRYGDLSDLDLEDTRGNVNALAEKIQKKYGTDVDLIKKEIEQIQKAG